MQADNKAHLNINMTTMWDWEGWIRAQWWTARSRPHVCAKIELFFLQCKQSTDTDFPLNHCWSLTRKQIQAHTHIQMEADSMLWANGFKWGTHEPLSVWRLSHAPTTSHTSRARAGSAEGVCMSVCVATEISRRIRTRQKKKQKRRKDGGNLSTHLNSASKYTSTARKQHNYSNNLCSL